MESDNLYISILVKYGAYCNRKCRAISSYGEAFCAGKSPVKDTSCVIVIADFGILHTLALPNEAINNITNVCPFFKSEILEDDDFSHLNLR